MSLSFNHPTARRRSLLALLCAVAVAAAASPPPRHSSVLAAGQTARPAPGDVAADPQMPADLREAVERSRYRISAPEDAALPGGYRAINPAQAFSTTFTDAGPRVQPRIAAAQAEPAAAASATTAAEPASGWQWGMRLRGYGYGEQVQEVQPAALAAAENRIEYRRGELTEWYVNDRRGVEQGFTLAARPAAGASGEPLVVRLSVEGDLRAESGADNQHIYFVTEGGARVLSYSKLAAFDARGKALAARMRVAGGEVRLEVDDEGAEYPLTIDPLIALETKLTASDAAAEDFFGGSVAVSGDTAVVGASGWFTDGDAGSAYVFVRNSTLQWSQQAKLIASDAGNFSEFGYSVAISGDTIVVGDRRGDSRAGEQTGAAYVFVRNSSGVWSQQAKLTASDADVNDDFGRTVSISSGRSFSNPTIVVSARNDATAAGEYAGSVYVFVRSNGQWSQQARLTASDADGFESLGGAKISGNTIVAHTIKGIQDAAVYVFVRSGTIWTEQAKLTASDAPPCLSPTTAISGDTIVVGYSCDSMAAGYNSGSAYVFVRSGTVWTEQAKLTAGDAAADDFFGDSVAVSGDTIVVGAKGDDISIVLSSSPPIPVIKFVKGAGSAYVFVRSNGQWSQQLKLTASDAAETDGFGDSVAISGDAIVAGASQKSSAAGQYAGAAYVKLLVDAVPY